MSRFFQNLDDTTRARWAATGYDLVAAGVRCEAADAAYLNAKTDDSASDLIGVFYAEEKRAALRAGMPADDADIWRFDAAPKHYE